MNYQNLVEVYQKLETTTKRLEKTHIISQFLRKVDADDLPVVILLLQGKVFPNWDQSKIGVASRMILKAIATATGIPANKIEESWKKTGDLGDTAEKLVGKKKQITLFSKKLEVKKVFDNLRKLATMEGQGTVDRKVQLIAELLTSAKPIEARYVIRTVLGELRVGVGEGSLRDAIVWAFFEEDIGFKYDPEANNLEIENRDEYNKYVGALQEAYDLTNDFASVAKLAKVRGLKGLSTTKLIPGTPIKVMLAIKVKDVEEGFERVGKPAAVEFKYDGFRMQVHKDKDEKISIFTRRLEEVTKQFPEVVKYVKEKVKGSEFILDCEAVGYDKKTGKYLPFQNVSQRIKRKYDIDMLARDLPVELNVFDIIYYEGKNLIKEWFGKRHELLWKIINQSPRKIVLAKNLVTSDEKEVTEFYEDSLKAGNEGIMFKSLNAPYKPGARVGHMVKLKPTMETLDLVIVGADWGEGKRANWLSSYTLACIDEDGNFLEVGKVGTGIKEKEEEGITFEQLTKMLKPLIISSKGKEVKVKPKVVIEIRYEEIQKSPTYSSGYALRFPRLVTIREDRSPNDVSTLEMVEEFYLGQGK